MFAGLASERPGPRDWWRYFSAGCHIGGLMDHGPATAPNISASAAYNANTFSMGFFHTKYFENEE